MLLALKAGGQTKESQTQMTTTVENILGSGLRFSGTPPF